VAEAVNKTLIGLTDLAREIAKKNASDQGFSSLSEYVEWLILCQQFSEPEAAALLQLRNKRGGRGGVHVLPDHATLPPEG
jgi:hypothetical protein